MFTQEQVNEAVILHVIHSKERLKLLVKPLTDQKTNLLDSQDKLFKGDILEQYTDLVKYEILLDCVKYLALSADSVKITIDSLNVNELLR